MGNSGEKLLHRQIGCIEWQCYRRQASGNKDSKDQDEDKAEEHIERGFSVHAEIRLPDARRSTSRRVDA